MTSIQVALTLFVVAPYTLALLWCSMLYVIPIAPHLPVPRPLAWILTAGAFIAFEARRDRFWMFMMWFPAVQIAWLAGIEVAVGILFLHLTTAGIVAACGHRLDALTSPQRHAAVA